MAVPLNANEDNRLTALHSYNILDTIEEKDFDDLTGLASIICETPVALISLVDKDRQWFKSHHGVDISETPIGQSFCAHAIASVDDIMVVENARLDKRFADNPLVTGPTNLVFYAGVPLVNEDGFSLGTLCVVDRKKKELTAVQTSALKILARQVIDKLELRRKIALIEKKNQELLDSNSFIQKFASMAAHDIKNPLTSILLTSQTLKLKLNGVHENNCEKLVDLNITATKRLISLLDEMLAYSKSPSLLLAKKQQIGLVELLENTLSLVTIPDNFIIEIPDDKVQLHISLVAFEQIFINLLSNAIRYNDKERGLISVRFSEDPHCYNFEIEDNGIGISEEYHTKIFTDNFTLQVTDRYNKKGSGIGLATVKNLVNALNGVISLTSVVGEGTIFFVKIKK